MPALLLAGWQLHAEPAPLSSPYRIDGIVAPQVQRNPLADQLESRLKALRKDIEKRSQRASLRQVLEVGLLNNPVLAEAYSNIQQRQWDLIAVRRQWYPTISASTGNSNGLVSHAISTTSARGPGTSNATTYANISATGVGLSLGWSFFDPSRSPAINAASEQLSSQQLLFDVSARNLVLQLQQNYFNLQQQELLINTYNEILANTDRQVQVSEAKFNAGLVSLTEVEQIRTQQYSTLTQLIGLYGQLIDQASQLSEATAMPPGTLVLPADAMSVIGSWETPLNETIAQALRLREEIKASLAASASARWRATALLNQYLPRFSVGAAGSYGSNYRTSGLPGSSTNASYSTSANWNSGISLGFTWKIFDGGIAAAEAQSSKSLALQQLDQAAVQRLNVTQEVEQAYGAYLTAQMALQSSSAQALSAQKSVLSAQERFNVGVTDMTTVVQTLSTALLAANSYAASVRDYNIAVASLYRSSAQWPNSTLPLIKQRVEELSRE